MHHPFYPTTVTIPHYVPSKYNMLQILIPFFAAIFILIVASVVLVPRNKFSFIWFLLCGFIHFVIEGYFALNHATIAGQTTFLADLWKEYALSDSRYMTSDSFVYLMETITAFVWGPLSFFTSWLIYKNDPARHFYQIIISLGQLYGDILYYTTTISDGGHWHPHPYYYWFYFVFMNMFWIIIPLCILVSSGKEVIRALRATLSLKKNK
jgi:cholestenol delta-isomerase